MEAAFQEGLQTGELNLLSRVLRTYAIIDKTKDAEILFREVIVKPYMSEVGYRLLRNAAEHLVCTNAFADGTKHNPYIHCL